MRFFNPRWEIRSPVDGSEGFRGSLQRRDVDGEGVLDREGVLDQPAGLRRQPRTGLQRCVTPVVTAVHCVNPPAPLDRGCPPSAGAVTAPCHGAEGGPGPWCLVSEDQ
ncbi:unnamed protein product [Boreogadus saida]